jgi:hypothetical protein
VAAGAVDLVALVDSQVGSHAGELDDSIPFLRTQFAGVTVLQNRSIAIMDILMDILT